VTTDYQQVAISDIAAMSAEDRQRLRDELIANLDVHISSLEAEFAATDWHDWRHMDAFEHARNLQILRTALIHGDLQRSLLRQFFELEILRLQQKQQQMEAEGNDRVASVSL
jgi:hypothetical protein